MDIKIITGGSELLKEVKPLWEQLNLHHKKLANNFLRHFEELNFIDRESSFIKKYKLKVDLVKDNNKDLYVGYCISSISEENVGEIDSLYVDKRYRKYGVGDRLMKDALKWFDNNSVILKTIVVAEGNEEVLKFYEKYGFYTKKLVLQQI